MNIEALKEIQNRRMEIAKRKNHDYAQAVDAIAICGIYGLATRIMDKAGRILSLAKPGVTAQVTDESIKDTLLDLANYAEYGVSLLEGTWGKPIETTSSPLAQVERGFGAGNAPPVMTTYTFPDNPPTDVAPGKDVTATAVYPLGKSWVYRTDEKGRTEKKMFPEDK